MEKENVTVPAVERALDVIELLSEGREPMMLKAMADELNIPTASLFRIIKNLVARGYLQQVSSHPLKYTMGYKILQLSSWCDTKSSITELIKPYMERVSRQTNQTSQFAVFRGGAFMYIEQVLSAAPVNYMAQLYSPLALNTSAGAKCIVAQQQEEAIPVFLDEMVLEKRTKHSIVDRGKFIQELQKTRTQGYGIDDEEFGIGIGCIAVPVFGAEEVCVGALGITGPAQEYKKEKRFKELKDMIVKAGQDMSEELSQMKYK